MINIPYLYNRLNIMDVKSIPFKKRRFVTSLIKRKYFCPYPKCDLKLSSKRDLKKHLKTHNIIIYRCKKCLEEFHSSSQLNLHKRRKHYGENFGYFYLKIHKNNNNEGVLNIYIFKEYVPSCGYFFPNNYANQPNPVEYSFEEYHPFDEDITN